MSEFPKLAGVAICTIVVLAFAAAPSLGQPVTAPDKTKPATPTKSVVGDNVTTEPWQINIRTIACEKSDDTMRVFEFVRANDKVAFRAYYDPLIYSGTCVSLGKGTKVFVSEDTLNNGLALRARVRGDPKYRYVPLSSLEPILAE